MTRRPRHGRGLRASAGSFPSAAVGRARLGPIVDAAVVRLARLTDAGRPWSAVPAFQVVTADLPNRREIEGSSPSAVADGALLASHVRADDGTVTVTLYSQPLRLWSDGTGVPLARLVRRALVEQVAAATGQLPEDLDPDVE